MARAKAKGSFFIFIIDYITMSQDNFDLHEWRLYQANLNLLNEEESSDEWDLGDLGPEWNVTELTVGDYIEPEMWGEEFDPALQSKRLQIVGIDEDEDGTYIMLNTPDGFTFNFDLLGLDSFNDFLKPQYKFVSSDFLEEQDDEWDLGNLGDDWNVTELTAGDTITPDMWIDGIFDSSVRKWNELSHKITEYRTWGTSEIIVVEGLDGELDVLSVNWVNNQLKPQYRIVPPESLNEQEDDEWDLGDLGDEWNTRELTVGDYIEPDMWRDSAYDDYFQHYKWLIEKPGDHSHYGKTILLRNPSTDEIWNLTIERVNDILKPQYKVIPPLTESDDDEWDLGNLGPEWNAEDLDVGSTITPNMWEDGVEDSQVNGGFDKPRKIVKIWNGDIGGEKWFTLKLDNNVSVHSSWLKPEFHLFKGHELTEQDEDEWDLGDLGDEWNVTELGLNDVITPDMWDLNKMDDEVQNQLNIKSPNTIINFYYSWYVWVEFNSGKKYRVEVINRFLKPQYKILPPEELKEQEDNEWDLGDLGDEWNTQELTVGDYIEPDMWKEHWYTNKVKKKPRKIKSVTEDDLGIFFWVEGDVHLYANENLKPQYKVVPSLFESEDEWDLGDLDDSYWNVTELGEGDILTSKMFKKPLYAQYFMDNNKSFLIKKIIKKQGKNVAIFSKPEKPDKVTGFNSLIDQLNIYLKPQYQIVPPEELQEQEDEWDLGDLGNTWNVTELTIGDTVTPKMWREDLTPTSYFIKHVTSKPQVIRELIEGDELYIFFEGVDGYVATNDDLKPQYRVVQPEALTENEDDEWDLGDLGQEWNITELTVGDTITPNMWNQDKPKRRKYFNTRKPITIDKGWGNALQLTDLSGGSDSIDIDILNKFYLKPEYKVVLPFNESEEEDEWDLGDLGDEWNEKELGVGDTIIGDMWDWKKIINAVNNEHGDNHAAINRDINNWKTVYDEGATIKRINSGGDYAWIDFGYSGLFSFGPSVRWINSLLSPGYKVYVPMNEQDDEWDLGNLGDEWNVTELTVGDKITPDMLVYPEDKNKWAQYHLLFGDPNRDWEITQVRIFPGYDHMSMVVEDINGNIHSMNVKWFESYLKPQYIIVPPETLKEQEDEWDLGDLGSEWNTKSITVGDYLDYNNSKIGNKSNVLKIVDYNPEKNSIGTLKGIINDQGEFETTQTKPFRSPVRQIEKYLKPGYELVLPNDLNE